MLAPNTDGIRLPEVTAGLPSQLLLRRPDVAEAEANLAAAHANLQAARAAFLSQFALSGGYGFGSTAINALLHGPSLIWDAGAQLMQTIFAGGKLVGQKDLALATQDEGGGWQEAQSARTQFETCPDSECRASRVRVAAAK